MGAKVAVVGASGYAGGELLRLLVRHPEVELTALCANGSAGRRVTDLHPHLVSLGGRVFTLADPVELGSADVVVTALPHGASAALVAQLPTDVRVIDLGADFRLHDSAQWDRFYSGPHAGVWPYGLPELPGQRDTLQGARRIAVAGCYATAVQLAYAPLLASGLIEPADLVAVASSGVSGAGRAASAALLGTEVMGDMSAYKVGRHQHVAEILQSLGSGATLSLTTTLAPMPRGILATCTARTSASEADLRAAVAAAYDHEPLVHLLPEGTWPHTAATYGSGSAHLQLAVDDRAGRGVVSVALDNLGKGAAAQGVQCLNLSLGLPETLGIPVDGVAP